MSTLFTMTELCECAKREVKLRQRVYPNLIAQGKMNAEKADREIELMRAIAAYFEAKAQPKLL